MNEAILRSVTSGSATSPVTPGATLAHRRALTTRFLDFWLLGGASLLVWLVMFSLQGFRAAWAIDQHFKNLTVTTASLSLLVNYPHFLISYKLAYSRGRSFILEHWWQMLFVTIGALAIAPMSKGFGDPSLWGSQPWTLVSIAYLGVLATAGTASAQFRVPQVPVAGGGLQAYLNSVDFHIGVAFGFNVKIQNSLYTVYKVKSCLVNVEGGDIID